jgi:hypothetical protein
MTTGRINQVTIVRRGWPTGACFSAGEMSKLLVGAPKGTPAQRLRLGLWRRWAIRFPPPNSPGHPSTAPHPLWAVWSRRPKRRTRRAASAISASAARGYLPMLCDMSRHRPVTHRAQLAAAGTKPPASRHPQYAVPPRRPTSWGTTPTMNPPLARPEPASLYRGPPVGILDTKVQFSEALRFPGRGCPAGEPAQALGSLWHRCLSGPRRSGQTSGFPVACPCGAPLS